MRTIKYFAIGLVGVFLAMSVTPSRAAVLVTVTPGSYTGDWGIVGLTGFVKGPITVSLAVGDYQLQVSGTAGGLFDFSVAAGGTVTVGNAVAARGGRRNANVQYGADHYRSC